MIQSTLGCCELALDADPPRVAAECALEFVKDAIVFIQIAELLSEVVVNVDRLDGFVFHGNIPDFQRQIVAR